MITRVSAAAVAAQTHVTEAAISDDFELVGAGFSSEDDGIQRAEEFPDITTPEAQRKGFALMRFANSRALELEGHGDLEKARALLAPMGLEPVPTPSGHARVSIGSMHYRFFAGLFKPRETWLAVVARPIGGGPAGHAYLHTVTDSRIMRKIGEGWGIPYERIGIAIGKQDNVAIDGYAQLHAAPGLPMRAFHQELDFRAYSPTGKTMEVHIEGAAQTRPFDAAHDSADFGSDTAMAKLQAALGFAPKRWVSHANAHGAIRA